MNAERLLAHYERIADAPDAIARLRRFVLDLALRGKLVPQDRRDAPVSELLKRIAAEKARLVKAGEIRSQRPIPALAEVPFPIPTNWRWSQIAEIGVLRKLVITATLPVQVHGRPDRFSYSMLSSRINI
jgi:type I restriction enzyme, S subunit